MKVDEMINELEKIKDDHGNIELHTDLVREKDEYPQRVSPEKTIAEVITFNGKSIVRKVEDQE